MKSDFKQFNPDTLTFATEVATALLLQAANFGADRSTGGKEIRLPLRMVRVESGRPVLRVATDSSTLSLPRDWGVVVYAKRSLMIESVESDHEVIRLDGDNFCVLIAEVGTSAIVRGSWYDKRGKWSSTQYIDDAFVFANELHPTHPYDEITNSHRYIYARQTKASPRPAVKEIKL